MLSNALPFLLSVDELHAHYDDSRLTLSNCSLIHVGSIKEYLTAHLPNAVFCDYTSLILGEKPAIGQLPEISQLEKTLSDLGIDSHQQVIVYDSNYGAQASRLLWTLHYLGHRKVSLLDGGIQKWAAQNFELTRRQSFPEKRQFKANINEERIADTSFILANLDNPKTKIVDARTLDEYRGIQSNSIRKGHIPGALHFNWQDNIDPYNFGCLKSSEFITEHANKIGLDKKDDIIVYCQTHQRSSHLYMTLRSCGFDNVRGYPGSWSQWGNDESLPLESS